MEWKERETGVTVRVKGRAAWTTRVDTRRKDDMESGGVGRENREEAGEEAQRREHRSRSSSECDSEQWWWWCHGRTGEMQWRAVGERRDLCPLPSTKLS